MRDCGALWQSYQADRYGLWRYDRRCLVDGVVYTATEIFSHTKTAGLLLDDFSVGNCPAARLDIELRQKQEVYVVKGSKVELQIRIMGEEGHTQWVSFGTFYVDEWSLEDGRLRLECYDRMVDLDRNYLYLGEASDNYPVTMGQAVQRICDTLQIELDARTVIRPDFMVPYPEGLTMREVLGFIGSSHGGNWHITDDNALRLVLPVKEPPLFSLGAGDARKIAHSGTGEYGALSMVYQDDGAAYESGSGVNVLTVFNLFATKRIAAYAQSVIDGTIYNAFTVTSAAIDPALELGDPIEILGQPANLWRVAYNTRLFCDISIPTTVAAGGSGGTAVSRVAKTVSGGGAPVILSDTNTMEVKVGQEETVVALIAAIVTRASDLQGQLAISLYAATNTPVIVRIYDGTHKCLYTPMFFPVTAGRNTIGLPHAYLTTLAEAHIFHVSLQALSGSLTIPTRGVLYTISGHHLEERTFDTFLTLHDITAQTSGASAAPEMLYGLSVEEQKAAVCHVPVEEAGSARWMGDTEVKDVLTAALEFDGAWVRLSEGLRFVTDRVPTLFFVDVNRVLWVRRIDREVPLALSEEVVRAAALRGWLYSDDFSDNDMGLIAAYIKTDGLAYYRQYRKSFGGEAVWGTEEKLPFTAAPPFVSVAISRTNDFRVAFSVEDALGQGYSLLSRRYYQGDSNADSFIPMTMGVDISMAEPIYPVVTTAYNTGHLAETVLAFSHPAVKLSGLQSAFTIKDAMGTTYTVTSTRALDGTNTSVVLTHTPYSIMLTGAVTVTFTNKENSTLYGPIQCRHQDSLFAHIHFGTGKGVPSPSDTQLFLPLGSKPVVLHERVKGYPVSYVTNKIALNPNEYVGKEIGEVGIGYGSESNTIVTHAVLQDSEGNPLVVTKGATDVLIIYATVYTHIQLPDNARLTLPSNNILLKYLTQETAALANTVNCSVGRLNLTGNDVPLLTSNLVDYSGLGSVTSGNITGNEGQRSLYIPQVRFEIDNGNGDIREAAYGNIMNIGIPNSKVSGRQYDNVAVTELLGQQQHLRLLPSHDVDADSAVVSVNGSPVAADVYEIVSGDLVPVDVQNTSVDLTRWDCGAAIGTGRIHIPSGHDKTFVYNLRDNMQYERTDASGFGVDVRSAIMSDTDEWACLNCVGNNYPRVTVVIFEGESVKKRIILIPP